MNRALCKLRLVRANNGRMLVSPNPEESMFNSAVNEAERKIKVTRAEHLSMINNAHC
jgi:hypothetical protein